MQKSAAFFYILYLRNTTTTEFSGDIKMQEDETADLRWFGLQELSDNINPNDRRPISQFVATRFRY